MHEVQITPELTVRVDTMGRVTILQYDPVISPRVATNTISVSASTGDKLVKGMQEVIKLHEADEFHFRRAG
jgi:hypothetical protein